MQNNWWKGVFKNAKPGSEEGLWQPLFEEMCLGGEIISWAALELRYCGGVLLRLKSLPIFRELRLLGKGAGESKVST